MIWIAAFHCDGIIVTISLVIRRVVGDIDLREEVQTPAVCLSPPEIQL